HALQSGLRNRGFGHSYRPPETARWASGTSLDREAARYNSKERSMPAMTIPPLVHSDRCSDGSLAGSRPERIPAAISLAAFVSEKTRAVSISKAFHRRASAIREDRAARVALLRNRHQAAEEKRLQERRASTSRNDATGPAASTHRNHACAVMLKDASPSHSVMSTDAMR